MGLHRRTVHRSPASPELLPGLLAARLAVAGPAPDFSARLRDRLTAASAASAAGAAEPSRRAVARRTYARPAAVARLTVAAAGGAVVLAGLGAGTARALPGQPLYAAKRAVEALQLDLRHGAASRGREQLAFARTRMGEVRALTHHHTLAGAGGTLAGGSADSRVSSTLRTMDQETRAGALDLMVAARRGDASAAAALIAFADAQAADLAALRSELPPAAVPAAEASGALIRDVRGQAVSFVASAAAPRVDPAAGPPAGPPVVLAPAATGAAPAGAVTAAVLPGPGAPGAAGFPSTVSDTAPDSTEAATPAPAPTTAASPSSAAVRAPATSPPTSAPTSPAPSPAPSPPSSPPSPPAAPGDSPPPVPVGLPTLTVGPIVLGTAPPVHPSAAP